MELVSYAKALAIFTSVISFIVVVNPETHAGIATCCNTGKLSILPTQCICTFRLILTINSTALTGWSL
jgi:hypothetical protein